MLNFQWEMVHKTSTSEFAAMLDNQPHGKFTHFRYNPGGLTDYLRFMGILNF